MTYQRTQIRAILDRLIVPKGSRATQTVKPSTANQYTCSFMTVYKDLGDDVFVAELLEEYLEENRPNPKTSRSVAIAVNHVVKQGAGFSEEVKRDMQSLCLRMCAKSNAVDTIKASWETKMPMLIKYRSVPYKELLLSLSNGADLEGDHFIRKQASVAFALIAANEPLRTDYRNIVIAGRCDPLPEKTPYYQDGKVYFPDGSRVKTGRGSPTLDVSECRELIDEFVGSHQSKFLFGNHMEANTFSHLLLDETERQLGDKLGIRFFRTKYGAEHRKGMRAANRQLKVMDHDMTTHDTFYTPPTEFDAALDAMYEEEPAIEDTEMEDAARTLLSFCT